MGCSGAGRVEMGSRSSPGRHEIGSTGTNQNLFPPPGPESSYSVAVIVNNSVHIYLEVSQWCFYRLCSSV